MFNVDETTGAIRMHSGDTGAFVAAAHRTDGVEFTEYDRAVYTIRNTAGVIVLQRVYALNTELGNGNVLVEFHNADTDSWPVGTYFTEMRYVINPYYSDDNVIPDDGDIVRTPNETEDSLDAHSTLDILEVYARI